MKISIKWLKNYLSEPIDTKYAIKKLTDGGLEVEKHEPFSNIKNGLENIVIGKIIDLKPHPNANRLKLAKVLISKETTKSIICGAPNIKSGQTVVVALEGSKLSPSNSKPIEIKRSKIRDVYSEGMICSLEELGLSKEKSEGIFVIKDQPLPGIPATNYFNVYNDEIIEIGLTPNRTDALGHIGVARDLIATLYDTQPNLKLVPPKPTTYKQTGNCKTGSIQVELKDEKLCKRYSGVLIQGIKNKPSPNWLKNSLEAIGIKPKNFIVDVTNFIMHEYGQPLHAFDADKISGNKVIIQTNNQTEKFELLDGLKINLSPSDLTIRDSKHPLCLAGIYGGKYSGITSSTTEIFLESAYFESHTIRKSSKNHQLNTDASYRYERGSDPNITLIALFRSLDIIKENNQSAIINEVVDIYPQPITPTEITLKISYLNKIIGPSNLSVKTIKTILEKLNITILNYSDDTFLLSVPTFKKDVTRPIDIVEEIIRIYGLNKIQPSKKLNIPSKFIPTNPFFDFQNTIRQLLSDIGFNEILNNSITKYSIPTTEEAKQVKLLSPLNQDHNTMRTNLTMQGLSTIAYNLNRGQENLKLFEIGKIYTRLSNNTFNELSELSIITTGFINSENWMNKPAKKIDLFFLKSIFDYLLNKLTRNSLNSLTILEHPESVFLDYGIDIHSKDNLFLASLGLIKQEKCLPFKIQKPIFSLVINIENLFKIFPNRLSLHVKEISKYPPVKRDLSFVIDESITFKSIYDECFKAVSKKNYLTHVELFDIYKGTSLPKGKKSYAISLTFQNNLKTFTDEEIERLMKKIIKAIEIKFKAVLRS